MPQAGGCAGTGHTGEGQAADPRSDPARWSARDPHARRRAAEDDPAGDHGDRCPGQPDPYRRIQHLRAPAGLGLPAQDGLSRPRRVCPRRGRRRLLRGARQHHGGCLVIAPLLAASASRHLAGEAATLSRLLWVRAQRAPARKSPNRRPYRCLGQVMCSITPEADKSLALNREGTMRLPEVANRLRELAAELRCDELSGLAEEIARRPSGQRAPKTSTPMTDSLRDEIRAMKEAEPNLSLAEIG